MMPSNSSVPNVTVISSTGGKVLINKSLLLENSSVIKNKLEVAETYPQDYLMLKESYKYLVHLKRYIEKRIVDITYIEDAFEIYRMAKDYKIKNLQSYCRYYIKEKINPCTLLRIYDFALEQNDKYIEYYCWIEFDEKSDEILKMQEFLTCEEHIIDLIVSRPKYKNLKEITLFECLVNWAITKYQLENGFYKDRISSSYNQRIRHYLNPFLKKIRFLSMDAEELKKVFSYEILYKDEEESIASNTKSRTLPITICKIELKRTEHCYQSLIVYKNRRPSKDTFDRYIDNECIFFCSFIPKDDCFLHEVIIPIDHYKGGIPLTVKVESSEIKLHEAEYRTTKFDNDGSHISLYDPLFLTKNIEYTVVGIIDFKKVEHIINLSKGAEFYIEDAKYHELKKNLNKLNWNHYVIKIRLYF